MNVKEIMNQAIELTGGTIDQFKTRRHINSAMSILVSKYDTACNKNTVTITCDDVFKEYPLPDDCFGVDRVKINGHKFNHYTVSNNFIQFEYIGDFEVKYLVRADLSNVKYYDKQLDTDIPPVNEAYHMAICFYVASKILPVNDANAVLFNNEFTTLSDDMNKKLMRQKRQGARIKAPLWR